MEWTTEAEGKLKDILAEVPSMVRVMAEGAARKKAEEKAEDRGKKVVELHDAVAGFIAATPFPMRRFLRPVLEKKGIDPSKYNLPK
ncbi:MAG: DUF2621 family protein [Thermincolia bacterium]